MSAASMRLEKQLNGGGNMPTVDVKNKEYATKTDVETILAEMADAPEGLLFGGAAYKVMKKKFRALDMENSVIDKDPDTGYYIKSMWSLAGADASITVDYGVPTYTNSNGYVRKAKRLTITA